MNNNEIQSDTDISKLKYEPLHFIRSHCEKYDMGDTSTQVRTAVFYTGRYMCIINVSTGELLMKYTHKEQNYEFYSLAWTQVCKI